MSGVATRDMNQGSIAIERKCHLPVSYPIVFTVSAATRWLHMVTLFSHPRNSITANPGKSHVHFPKAHLSSSDVVTSKRIGFQGAEISFMFPSICHPYAILRSASSRGHVLMINSFQCR